MKKPTICNFRALWIVLCLVQTPIAWSVQESLLLTKIDTFIQTELCREILSPGQEKTTVLIPEILIPTSSSHWFGIFDVFQIRNMSHTQLRITQAQKGQLVNRMERSGQRSVLMVSPIGLTLWENRIRLDQWLSLIDIPGMTDPLAAQKEINLIMSQVLLPLTGFADVWLQQLVETSLNRTAQWSLRSLQTYAVLALVDRLIVFDQNNARVLKDDQVSSFEERHLLASHPELLTLQSLISNQKVKMGFEYIGAEPIEVFQFVNQNFTFETSLIQMSATVDAEDRVVIHFDFFKKNDQSEMRLALLNVVKFAVSQIAGYFEMDSEPAFELREVNGRFSVVVYGPDKRTLALIALQLAELLQLL